jgi:hypothetical protein
MSKPILYDLTVALGSITLWLTPWDITRAAGYSLSILFSGRAYYTGIITLQKERKNDEKEAITYEADVDFTEQLLGTHVDAHLEIKTLEIENWKAQQLIPLLRVNQQLTQQLQQLTPVHPEISEQAREQAVKTAIEDAFQKEESKPVDEESIRVVFSESADATSWKAILKALQSGSDRDEIVKDVLGCTEQTREVGRAYFEFLKRKYL